MNDWRALARRRMREQKLSQERVAEIIGVTQGAVGHWLSGRREPESLEQYDLFAKAIGLVGAQELLFGDPTSQTASMSEAVRLMRGMSADEQRLAVKLIGTVVESRRPKRSDLSFRAV